MRHPPSDSRYLLAICAGAVALLVACSGGASRESVTLEQYFLRVQALHEKQERGSEAIGAQLAPAFRSLIEETRVGLDVLEPPSEVQEEHAELLSLYDDFVALIDDAAGQLARGEAPTETFQTLLGESGETALGVRFADLAERLTGIAQANGIAVTLDAGALAADSGSRRGPVAQPSVTAVAVTAPRLTGIDAIDAVFDTVTLASYRGDFTALEALVRFTTTACTQRSGLGGPPQCLSTTVEDASGKRRVWSEDEGQLVEVFPYSVCEGEYERRGGEIARLLTDLATPGGERGLVERAYAVYDLRDEAALAPYWPGGDYAILFGMRQGDERWGTLVRIADGGIVRIDFGCGRTPAEQMGIPGASIDLD